MVACTFLMHFLFNSIICPKISRCTLFTGRREYLRFSLQVLRVYLGCQFYHPNINYITKKKLSENRTSEVYIGIFFVIYDLY